MLRLHFVELKTQTQLLDFINPPALPVVGDVTEGPDGRLYVIAARAFLITATNNNIITLNKAVAPEPEVIVRCTLVEMNEDGSVDTDANTNGTIPLN